MKTTSENRREEIIHFEGDSDRWTSMGINVLR